MPPSNNINSISINTNNTSQSENREPPHNYEYGYESEYATATQSQTQSQPQTQSPTVTVQPDIITMSETDVTMDMQNNVDVDIGMGIGVNKSKSIDTPSDDAIFDLIHNNSNSNSEQQRERDRDRDRDRDGTSTSSPPSMTMFQSEINHFNLSPKIKRNPRDAKSPKRNRIIKKKESPYDDMHMNMNMNTNVNNLNVHTMSPTPGANPSPSPAIHSNTKNTSASLGGQGHGHGHGQGVMNDSSSVQSKSYHDADGGVGGGGGGGGGASIQSYSDMKSMKSAASSHYGIQSLSQPHYGENNSVASARSQSQSQSQAQSISSTPSRSRQRHRNSNANANVNVNANANANMYGTSPSPYLRKSPTPYHAHAHSPQVHTGAGASVGSRSINSSGTGAVSRASRRSRQSRQSQSQSKNQQQQQQRQTRPSNQIHLGQEQELFEKRLCDENYGVAVRKIHSNGKSQLRHVKCIPILNNDKKGASGSSKMGSRMKHGHGHGHGGGHGNMSASVPDSSAGRSVTSMMGKISLGSRRKDRGSTSASASASASAHPTGNATVNTTSEGSLTTAMTEKQLQKQSMALTWGNKKKVVIPLYKFTAVRKGKTTNRTMRNPRHPSRLLSLVTSAGTGRSFKGKRHGGMSLDIEAPTKMDRDKFAKAFSVFLDVPLEDDFVGEDVNVNMNVGSGRHRAGQDTQSLDDFDESSLPSTSTASSIMTPHGLEEYQIGDPGALLPSLTSSPSSRGSSQNKSPSLIMEKHENILMNDQGYSREIAHPLGSRNGIENMSLQSADSLNDLLPALNDDEEGDGKEIMEHTNMQPAAKSAGNMDSETNKKENDDDRSAVSSLTQGFDQEIVEELHQALNELRAELESSRAEAARAVKVAEQAIQSAESCSSNDWNSTVTHKAAEAAALAQKRSAEAIAKQRHAQDKLTAERKSAKFWRRQAQNVEDEAAALQTRLAVAQVQRAAVTEELDREKRKAASYIQNMKRDYSMKEEIQRETLSSAAEQNRMLEIELDGTRRDLMVKSGETKTYQEEIADLKNSLLNSTQPKSKKKFFGKSKIPRGPSLLESNSGETSTGKNVVGSLHAEELLKIQAETSSMKKQFEILRRTTADELRQLPVQAKEWSSKASKAVNTTMAEVAMLKNQLALEMSNRRKLLNEVQDLRGTVRVYCRPRAPVISPETNSASHCIISVPSHDIGLLHRELVIESDNKGKHPMCFEFDRMFTTNASQSEVYCEMEELVLGCLEGFNASLIAYGQSGSGKTHSMIGDFQVSSGDGFGDDALPTVALRDSGIHLLAARQLFEVSNDREGRFEDSFTLSILEIQDEKLVDLVADTSIAEESGIVKGVDGRDRKVSKQFVSDGEILNADELSTKLEIRTNHEGDTIVQGQVTVSVTSFDNVVEVWEQSLAMRAKKLMDAGKSIESRDSNTHIIATIEVMSTNINTGIGTIAKLQCTDLAASDAIQKRGSNSNRSKATGTDNILAPVGNTHEWKFLNKSLSTFADVVDARVNFSRSVPYRNSTLTHILRDALEADTKTMFLVCVQSDADNLQDIANSLRFASKIRKVVVGKATKRHVSVA